VQQRPGSAALVAQARMGQRCVLAQELFELRGRAGADDLGHLLRQRAVRSQPRIAGQLLLRLVLGSRLGWEPGAGERGSAVGVVLHPHDAPVMDRDDHAGLATRQPPPLKPRSGHLDEDTLVDRDDSLEAGDDAPALALETRREHFATVVGSPTRRARTTAIARRGP
jgi:hypothetical protein